MIATIYADCTDNVVLCGDFNSPGDSSTTIDSCLAVALSSFNLIQYVDVPTHYDPKPNVLDLLASGNPATFSGVNVDPAGRISDHCIVTATFNVRPSVRRHTRRATSNRSTQ